MSFASPLNLLWLIPIAGGIIALWMLRVRRKEQLVASLFLWRQVTRTTKADTPLQRLRRNLLLFLQLLCAFLLVMALCHPLLRAAMPIGTRYAVIIDDSASMTATDASPSRLAASLAQAQQFLQSEVKTTDRVAIIVSAGTPRLLSAWSASSSRAQRALDSIQPTDIERDLPSAATLARTQFGRRLAGARIVIFSDGAWDSDEDDRIKRAAGSIPIALITAGEYRAANMGITGIDSRRDTFGANDRQVFVRVHNYGATVANARLVLTFRAQPLSHQTISLAAGASTDETITEPSLGQGGVVTAKLEGLAGDRLASDNSASLVLPPDRRSRVLLVSTGNLFLEKGLALDPNVDLYETTPSQYAQIHARYDLQVFDDFAPASLPPGNFLIFHATSAGMPVVPFGSDVSAPTIVDWSETNPLMRFVDLSDVRIGAAAHVTAADWGQTVVDSDSGPLVVAGERYGRRCVWVGFNTSAGDFPLKVAFPVFLTNALQWLTDSSGSENVIHPGEPIVLPGGSGKWRVRTDNSESDNIDCGDNSGIACIFTATDHAGLYRFVGKSGVLVYAADVVSDRTSNIGGRDHPGMSSTASGGSRLRPQGEARDLWVLAGLAALGFMLIEWLTYHRRP